jgi:hypothetical protein
MENKKRHKNQHEWAWMPEFGSEWQYCGLCKRASRTWEPKKYFTHKKALIEVLKEERGDCSKHPTDCDCEKCIQGGREAQEYYKKYYRIS